MFLVIVESVRVYPWLAQKVNRWRSPEAAVEEGNEEEEDGEVEEARVGRGRSA